MDYMFSKIKHHGVRRAITNIFNAVSRRELPRMPKGTTLYRVKSTRPGAMTDKGVVYIKSKGRTGARTRLELAKALRTQELRLPKRYKGKFYN